MQYTLRFTPPTRPPRELELQLCTACLNDLCTEPDVELVEDQRLDTVNPPSR